MSLKSGLTASLAIFVFSGLASAQDYQLPPTFGAVTLQPGFLPDPVEVVLVAGGPIDAATINTGCVGMIADAPDFRLTYGAGGRQLFIGVTSEADTTLVVNAPDGSWYCSDDYAGGLDPFVGGENPQAGQYDIWVGTYGVETTEATLYITEYSH
jgi:hypothetical protein